TPNRLDFVGREPTLPSRRLPLPAYLRSHDGKSLILDAPREKGLQCRQVAVYCAGRGTFGDSGSAVLGRECFSQRCETRGPTARKHYEQLGPTLLVAINGV